MPAKPTLMDFFKHRFAPAMHLLQSAKHARDAGMPEKVVLASLLHDIGVIGFIRSDHGYWGAQMVEPYVDEEVTWAIRAHQALRFYPDEENGYPYPDNYRAYFGDDYKPEPYIEAEYKRARAHKWYGTARISPCTTSIRSTRTCMWSWRSSPTWAPFQRRGWASTAAVAYVAHAGQRTRYL